MTANTIGSLYFLERRLRRRCSPARSFWDLRSHDIPESPGAYILIGRRGEGFRYPKGRSPVFYVGQSADIRYRLREHLSNATWAQEARERKDKDRFLYEPRYHYAAAFGETYVWIPTWQGLTPKALEDRILAEFVRDHLAFPVANGQGSWKSLIAEM